jgi:hypothetical protein
MADAKISQLPVATTPLAGTELVPLVQGGVTVQSTVDKVLTGTVPSGTANGVLYLNGSKVVTSGSALTFDGTTLNTKGQFRVTDSTNAANYLLFGSGADAPRGGNSITAQTSTFVFGTETDNPNIFIVNGSEQMRLTSTGLGIGTSSLASKLVVSNGSNKNLEVQPGATTYLFAYDRTASDYLNLDIGGQILTFSTDNGSERMRLDSSGNLGLGVTPSAWGSYRSLSVGTAGTTIWQVGSDFGLSSNAYNNSGWKYNTTGGASLYDLAENQHIWYTAPSGTAGNTISFTQALTLDVNRNLLLNGTAAPASGVGTFAIFNGTAPTGSVTDGCVLYTEDVSSSSELKVRDEAGNVTTLSPHNFELIPEGPSEDMAWSYYSERDGKRINVDMLKAIRLLEKLSGEKLVHFA